MVDVYWYFVLCTTFICGYRERTNSRYMEMAERKGANAKRCDAGREEFQIAIGMCVDVKIKPPLAAYRAATQFTYAHTHTLNSRLFKVGTIGNNDNTIVHCTKRAMITWFRVLLSLFVFIWIFYVIFDVPP